MRCLPKRIKQHMATRGRELAKETCPGHPVWARSQRTVPEHDGHPITENDARAPVVERIPDPIPDKKKKREYVALCIRNEVPLEAVIKKLTRPSYRLVEAVLDLGAEESVPNNGSSQDQPRHRKCRKRAGFIESQVSIFWKDQPASNCFMFSITSKPYSVLTLFL